MQTSSIKETLKKSKSFLTEDSPGKKSAVDDGQPIGLEDVKIEMKMTADVADQSAKKLDQSMNSVIRVEDDALNTSVVSVIRVSDGDKAQESEDAEEVKKDENLAMTKT